MLYVKQPYTIQGQASNTGTDRPTDRYVSDKALLPVTGQDLSKERNIIGIWMESGCHYLNACAITLKLTLKTDNWSRIGFKCIYIHEMKKSSLIRLDLSRFLSHKSTGQSGEGVGVGVGKQQCDTASLPPNDNIPCTAGEPPPFPSPQGMLWHKCQNGKENIYEYIKLG